jgi:hypothetical protein
MDYIPDGETALNFAALSSSPPFTGALLADNGQPGLPEEKLC